MAGLRPMHNAGDFLSIDEAMRWAIDLAKQGIGFVAPNPLVGCVILDKASKVIGWGHHAKVGGDHAETAALKTVKDPASLSGATVVVTLEPCSHFGRTPPCAEALAKLPLAQVVYGLVDPHSKVSGQGVRRLQDAKIKTTQASGDLIGELEDLAEIFLHNVRTSKAFVTVKVASTIDGQMALRSGPSQWLTGEESRLQAHRLRGTYDAVMLGKRTFLTDNPRLTNRHPEFTNRHHKVIVVDPRGEALPELKKSKMIASHAKENIIWVVSEEVKSDLPIQFWKIPLLANRSIHHELLAKHAFENDVTSILVEGGAHLISSLLEQNAVQRWYQFLAPDLVGAKEGLAVTPLWGVSQLDHKLKLQRPKWQIFGRDSLVTGRLS